MKTTLRVKKNGYVYKFPVELLIDENRIYFLQSPFQLKDTIKAMAGPKWHGYNKEDPRPIWSVRNCPRNIFQLYFLMGEPVYDHFKQELVPLPPGVRPELLAKAHQVDMVRRCLTYHFQILGAEPGLGKSLVGITVAELVGGEWWYVGPKSAGESFNLELEKWESTANFSKIITYQTLKKVVDYEKFTTPLGIFFDESTEAKTESTNRSKAAQYAADLVRHETNNAGYIILASGTPTAKSPLDIWQQAEIAWPGFLVEGSAHAFEQRYGYLAEGFNSETGVTFKKREGWNEEEVAKLPDRLKGLMTVYRKADCLQLPPKRFRRVRLEPSKKVLRVAQALTHVASSPAIALTWLRALSSGFQYITKETGTYRDCPACHSMSPDHDCVVCNNTRRIPEKSREPKMVHTPKCDALRAEIEGLQRVVISASFTGSIDRCHEIATEMGFATCVIDGRGWRSFDKDGELIKKLHPMRHWRDCKEPLALVGNPGSCKFGLTLNEAKKMIFFDNDFSAENRLQMMDRIHRIGQDESPEYVDFIHLPVDEKVLDILESNRSTELLSLGAISEALGEEPEEVELS